jgi:enoyl-CoA hydratase/carnithine racemase
MKPFLLVERDGAVVIATLNRPEQRNAISETAYSEEIAAFCDDVTRDPMVRAIVLTGSGSAFCAGGNIRHMQEKSGMFAGSPYVLRNKYRTGIQLIPAALYELEVPVIAAINGPAIGAGLDLACMCDIRIAADTAIFAESFVKLGLIPGDGGAWLLPRVIGMPRAAQMTLTGETIDAATALAYGLITEILPADQLIERALVLAADIAANPGHATRMAKRLLREGQNMRLAPLLELSAAYQALAHHTEEHDEALATFAGKQAARLPRG